VESPTGRRHTSSDSEYGKEDGVVEVTHDGRLSASHGGLRGRERGGL